MPIVINLRVDPRFDSMRPDYRLQELIRRVGDEIKPITKKAKVGQTHSGNSFRILVVAPREEKSSAEETAAQETLSNSLPGSRRRRRTVVVSADPEDRSGRNRLQAEGFTVQSHGETIALLEQGQEFTLQSTGRA